MTDNIRIELEGEDTVVYFSKNLFKERIRDLKDVLIKSINEAKHLVFDLASVKKTDMFFVQLLCASHKYAVKKNKNVKLRGPIPENLKIILDDYGFYRDKGCIKGKEESCFWLREGSNV